MQETLAFHRLTFVPERDGITVGRPDIESYAILPEDGAQLLRVLADGMSTEAAAAWYEAKFGESVDMGDFVSTMSDLGFIRSPDEEETEASSVGLQTLGKALFSPFAWAVYALMAAATAFLSVRFPELRPRPENVFFVSYLILVQVVVMVIGMMAGTLLHEWFHLMAGRRRGLPSRISARVAFLPLGVFETKLNGLLGLPRRQRYVPFFAGIVADAVFYCALVLAAAALRGGPHWLWQMLLAIAYVNLIRLPFQMLLFMRTDPYYALTTALGCVNLTGAARDYLRHKIGRKRSSGSGADEETYTPIDRAAAPWFTLLSALGVALLATILVFGFIPVAITFFTRLGGGFIHHPVMSLHFWDSAAVVIVLIVDTAIGSTIVALGKRLLRTGRETAA